MNKEKKSPFPPQKRLFEKEYFCHLVMSKKKNTRKIREKTGKNMTYYIHSTDTQ